jgi:hypothetical protein
MKKRIFWIISGIVILMLIVMMYFIFIIPIINRYDTQVEERQFPDIKVSISIPKRWIVYDVEEVYESKPGYEGKLIITGRNIGGFPYLRIYRIALADIEFQETIENSLILWNKSRVEASAEDDNIIFDKPVEYLSGLMISYLKDDSSVDSFARVACKDWIKIMDQDAYVVSICEFENKWETLEEIYPDIIEGFEVID